VRKHARPVLLELDVLNIDPCTGAVGPNGLCSSLIGGFA
jgi:hypothetical protein